MVPSTQALHRDEQAQRWSYQDNPWLIDAASMQQQEAYIV